MNRISTIPRLPPDPLPTNAKLEAILRPQNITSLDEYVARLFATLLWRVHRHKADLNAFLLPEASDVFVFPGGHLTFNEYLEGDHWRHIRHRVMQRTNNRCECCSARATDIYIRDYRPQVLWGEDFLPLVALCRSCRDYIDNDPVTGGQRERYQERG